MIGVDRRGHGEIGGGHGDGFGGDQHGSPHGWLVLLGFRWVFFFFFFNMGFCSGGILVSSGQWWLGFFWVFVPLGFSGLIINDFWIFLTVGFFWVDHWLQLV